MFKFGKDEKEKEYFSIREKIDHYTKRLKNVKSLTDGQRKYAEKRLKQLKQIDAQSYSQPTLVLTDDTKYGNKLSKPRVAIVVKTRDNGELLVAPLYKTTSKQVVLDRDCGRQISKTGDGKNKWLTRDDIYDLRDVTDIEPLTEYDKRKIINLYK